MRKKIIFVDDEPNVLKAMERNMRVMHSKWDMMFLQEPEEALELLEKSSFDVIVSDMCMPGLDGACLMAVIKEKYPWMLRIILSGDVHPERLSLKVHAHKCLVKPCEKSLLIKTIESGLLDTPENEG